MFFFLEFNYSSKKLRSEWSKLTNYYRTSINEYDLKPANEIKIQAKKKKTPELFLLMMDTLVTSWTYVCNLHFSDYRSTRVCTSHSAAPLYCPDIVHIPPCLHHRGRHHRNKECMSCPRLSGFHSNPRHRIRNGHPGNLEIDLKKS